MRSVILLSNIILGANHRCSIASFGSGRVFIDWYVFVHTSYTPRHRSARCRHFCGLCPFNPHTHRCHIFVKYYLNTSAVDARMQVLAADGSARGPHCNAKAATCHVVLAFRQSVRTAVPVLLRAMPIQSRSSLSARTVIFLSNIIAPPRDSTCEDCLARGIPLKESREAAPTDRCHASNHCVGASISQPAPQWRTRQDVI